MENQKTHWRELQDYKHLGAHDLENGEDLIVTIKEVTKETILSQSGNEETCMVAKFEDEEIKPMIVNITNSKTISQILASPYVEKWIGKKIQLYSAEITAWGEEMIALRVRPYAPKGKIKEASIVKKIKAFKTPQQLKEYWFELSHEERNNRKVINAKNSKKNELK